jgi:preflagellin peptidase FlaK
MIEYTLIVPLIAVLATFAYAAYLDFKTNIIPFKTWFPMIIISMPFSIFWYYNNFLYSQQVFFILIATLTLICGAIYIISLLKLMGGADAMGLIFLAICLPTFVTTPIIGEAGYGIFMIAVIVNAMVMGAIMIPLLVTTRTDDDGNRIPGIPFIVPVFFSIIVSTVFGDLLTMIMRVMFPT